MKLNDAEMPVVLNLLGLPAREADDPAALRAGAERVLAEFPTLNMVAVTRGGSGSLLVTREAWHEHPGIPTTVADTIGAGDAFTAALTHYLLQGAGLDTKGLATLNEAGNRWGAWVASQQGAMPALSDETRARIEAVLAGSL
jgi:fructokinase